MMMERQKRNKILLLVLAVLLLAAATTALLQYRNHARAAAAEQERQELAALREAYYNQSYAFCAHGYTEGVDHHEAGLETALGENFRGRQEYRDYSYVWEPALYCELVTYQYHTGVELTLGEVKDFLSQEYEEDGTPRYYNNGRHPKIQDYVARFYVRHMRFPEMHMDEVPEAVDYKRSFELFVPLIQEYIEAHPESRDYFYRYIDAYFASRPDSTMDEDWAWRSCYDQFGMDVLQEFGNKILDPDYEIALDWENR